MLRPVLISLLGGRYFPESLDCFTGIRNHIPQSYYDRPIFNNLCDRIYNLIYERAIQGLAWVCG